MRKVRNPSRYLAAVLQRRAPKPPPVDLTGIEVKQLPPGEARNAAKLAGVIGSSGRRKGGPAA